MGKFLTTLVVTAVIGCLSFSKALADEVILNQGDRLTGTVNKVADGKMTLHSDLLGDVVIPLNHIRTFSTNAPIELHLTDGTVVKRQLTQSDPGEVVVGGEGFGAGQKLAVTSIDEVNPQGFTGLFQVGGALTRGNSFTDTLNASFVLGYKHKEENVAFTGEYNYGKQKDRKTGLTSTTTDRWVLDAKYEHSFTKKVYGFLEGEITKDRVAFLDLRFNPSAGVGYKWFDKTPFFFSTEAGVAWIYENYTNGTPTREEVALKLAYHLRYEFNPNVNVFNDLTYFPSLERGKNYFVNADVGFHAKLFKNLFTELKIEWNYDSNPANGALKNDERFVATLGYSL